MQLVFFVYIQCSMHMPQIFDVTDTIAFLGFLGETEHALDPNLAISKKLPVNLGEGKQASSFTAATTAWYRAVVFPGSGLWGFSRCAAVGPSPRQVV